MLKNVQLVFSCWGASRPRGNGGTPDCPYSDSPHRQIKNGKKKKFLTEQPKGGIRREPPLFSGILDLLKSLRENRLPLILGGGTFPWLVLFFQQGESVFFPVFPGLPTKKKIFSHSCPPSFYPKVKKAHGFCLMPIKGRGGSGCFSPRRQKKIFSAPFGRGPGFPFPFKKGPAHGFLSVSGVFFSHSTDLH